jgi:hypothetical protein
MCTSVNQYPSSLLWSDTKQLLLPQLAVMMDLCEKSGKMRSTDSAAAATVSLAGCSSSSVRLETINSS